MMKNRLLLFLGIFMMACSTGQKAFERGNYFQAVLTSIDRLRSNPDHNRASNVLQSSYPMAIKWVQDEIDLTLSSNEPLKWDKTVTLMQQVNDLAYSIRQCPAALHIVSNPKVYSSELTMAKEKAAEENYQNGLSLLNQRTREAAKQAYYLFARSNNLIQGYKESIKKMKDAKEMATTYVVVEPFPVHSLLFQLSADFFYNQIFEFVNNRFPTQGFVEFFSPDELEKSGIGNPDMILRLEFYDFVVGNTQRSDSEKEVSRTFKVETKDSLKTPTITYRAKLKIFTEKVTSGGVVDLKIIDYPTGKLLVNDRVPGEYIWINQFAMFVGDEKALSDEEFRLTKQKALTPPPPQALFIEFTKPIYDRLTGRILSFFKQYN